MNQVKLSDSIFNKLKGIIPKEYIKELTNEFENLKKYYFINDDIRVGMHAAHFCELTSSLLCNIELGLTEDLNKISFNDNINKLIKSSKKTSREEIFRLLIPQVLRAVYTIRNKKKVAHYKKAVPVKIDLKYILNSIEWIIAQLLLQYGNYNDNDVINFLENLTYEDNKNLERFENGDLYFYKDLTLEEIILFHLGEAYNSGRISLEILYEKLNYKNKSYFKKLIGKLKVDKYIHINENGILLSNKGINRLRKIRRSLMEGSNS
ncbi:MAG: hypothetical protein JSV62_02550 [Promethearchaeota archaeon]|nr:MAG: hypothetical protein JSV62_02550 [Candidatus Lokiarchaeota archaeon]